MEFKNAFSASPGFKRTNNAGLAPYPTRAFETVQYWNERYYREGVHADGDAVTELGATRKTLAQFLGCDLAELAFTQSTAHSISQVALGLKLKAGDEILVWDQEYPSNYYPWFVAAQKTGAKLIAVASGADYQTPFEKICEKITPQTRVIAISWIQYQTGAVTDIEKLSIETRARGIWLVVDGIQAIGARPFHFKTSGIDVLCGGSHKWLCSPLSTGYLVVRAERISEIDPIMVGALTYGTPNDRPVMNAQPHRDATRFEPGARSFLPLFAMKSALEVLQEAGLHAIQNESMRLARDLHVGLKAMGFNVHTHGDELQSPILTFSHATWSVDEIMKVFAQAKIGATPRGPGVRVSPHAFNRDDEMMAVLQTLGSHLPKR